MGRQVKDLGLSTTFEIPIFDFNTKVIRFTDVETSLDNVLVNAIQFIPLTGVSFSHRPLVDPALASMCSLTLTNAKDDIYNNAMPMDVFSCVDMEILHIQPKLISIRKSFIEIPEQGAFAAIPAGGAVFLFTFFYEKFNPNIHFVNGIGELI